MKRLFILFLVAIMLAGCGRKSIVGHDIDGQDVPIPQQTQQAKEKTEEETKEKSEEEPARKGQKGKIVDGIKRHNIIYGTGMIVVGAATFWNFENDRIQLAGLYSIVLGIAAVAGEFSNVLVLLIPNRKMDKEIWPL